jgi:glycosyltransferase involved in cell wall biosynthesis
VNTPAAPSNNVRLLFYCLRYLMPDEHPVFFFPRVLPLNYRVAVLERLNERLNDRLVVCSGRPPGGSSLESIIGEKEYAYRQVELPNYWLNGETVHAQPFGRAFRCHGTPSVVMIEESPRTLTQPFLLAYAKWKGAGRVLWGHFSSNNRPFRPNQYWQDRYRLWTAHRAEACVCYTDAMAELLRPHLPKERLFVARNTLDTDTLFALYDSLNAEGRVAVRRRLNLPPNAPVLTFIGRLIPEKGTDVLLNVFDRLRAERPMTLQVIGDGPARQEMERRVAHDGINDVRFLGAIREWDESAPYLYASDVMLQPGYLGLSVNHAFSFGVPVVSQAAPASGERYHSPEAHFVEHGKNGMLAKHGSLDSLTYAVRRVLTEQDRFSEHARRYARNHLTIGRMVDGLEASVRRAERC